MKSEFPVFFKTTILTSFSFSSLIAWLSFGNPLAKCPIHCCLSWISRWWWQNEHWFLYPYQQASTCPFFCRSWLVMSSLTIFFGHLDDSWQIYLMLNHLSGWGWKWVGVGFLLSYSWQPGQGRVLDQDFPYKEIKGTLLHLREALKKKHWICEHAYT